jgi:hypothetical protein
MSPRLTFVTSDAIMTRGLRGRTWLVGGLLGLMAGFGVYYETPPAYTATSVVELTSLSPVIDLSATAAKLQPFTVDSDAQIVADGQVVSAVAAITKQPSAQVRRSLSVSARQLTRVLQITYTASSPVTATAGAQGAADAFLAEREKLVVKPVQDYLAAVFAKTESPQKSTTLATEDLTSRAQSRVESWRQRAVGARLQSKGAGSVLEHAQVRAGGDRGDIEIPVVTGACLGGLLGVGVALLRSQLGKPRGQFRVRRPGARGSQAAVS